MTCGCHQQEDQQYGQISRATRSPLRFEALLYKRSTADGASARAESSRVSGNFGLGAAGAHPRLVLGFNFELAKCLASRIWKLVSTPDRPTSEIPMCCHDYHKLQATTSELVAGVVVPSCFRKMFLCSFRSLFNCGFCTH